MRCSFGPLDARPIASVAGGRSHMSVAANWDLKPHYRAIPIERSQGSHPVGTGAQPPRFAARSYLPSASISALISSAVRNGTGCPFALACACRSRIISACRR
jgi:hypothetical protein